MAMAYVKMFVDWADIISPLDDAERGRLFTAILEYARTGFGRKGALFVPLLQSPDGPGRGLL